MRGKRKDEVHPAGKKMGSRDRRGVYDDEGRGTELKELVPVCEALIQL